MWHFFNTLSFSYLFNSEGRKKKSEPPFSVQLEVYILRIILVLSFCKNTYITILSIFSSQLDFFRVRTVSYTRESVEVRVGVSIF